MAFRSPSASTGKETETWKGLVVSMHLAPGPYCFDVQSRGPLHVEPPPP